MAKEKENGRASDLMADVKAHRGGKQPNIWWQLIDTFLETWREETADSTQPITRVTDRLYEFVAEKRREKGLGEGIFMSTIHAAKGMEFPHVFILDGDWRHPADKSRWEEERRIMYVAMTRAMETLRLMKNQGKPNPFLKDINGNFVMPFTHVGMVEESKDTDKRYEIAGLNEIYLDYAGGFPQTHPIHSRLAALTAGQQVNLVIENEKLEIRDHSGECVGRFSKEGAGKWRERLANILEVRVVGLLQRNRDDPDAPFHKRIKADKWEFPVLEIISTAQPV